MIEPVSTQSSGLLWIIWIIGIFIVAAFIFRAVREYTRTTKEKRPVFLKTYIIIAVLSIGVFIGLRMGGYAEKMYPEYYPNTWTQEEIQEALKIGNNK